MTGKFSLSLAAAHDVCIKLDSLIQTGIISKDKIMYNMTSLGQEKKSQHAPINCVFLPFTSVSEVENYVNACSRYVSMRLDTMTHRLIITVMIHNRRLLLS